MHYFMSQAFDKLVLVVIIHQFINEVTLTLSVRASTKYPILEIFPLTLSTSIGHIFQTNRSNALKFGSFIEISPRFMSEIFYDIPLKTIGTTLTSFRGPDSIETGCISPYVEAIILAYCKNYGL